MSARSGVRRAAAALRSAAAGTRDDGLQTIKLFDISGASCPTRLVASSARSASVLGGCMCLKPVKSHPQSMALKSPPV
eukprot:305781-Chlamydomonas_euryale.AAC.1